MGARAESQPSRGLERGGFLFSSSAVSTLISLSLSLIVSAGSHTTHQLHTPHTAHTPGSRQAAALRVGLAPVDLPPPPRTVRCDAHTRSSLYSLTLSELLKDSKNTRGDPRGRATERVRRRHPTPTTGATRGGTPVTAPGGRGGVLLTRGPACGVWRVDRERREVSTARARRCDAGPGSPAGQARKPPLYKF